jgi:2-oxoglutarate/2-oxoacid ferredoxin oxidoreductase subunit beta
VVEILSQCPTYYGRKNKEGDAAAMLEIHKNNTARLGSKALEDHPGLIARGVFVDIEKPEYCEAYDEVIARAQGGKKA